MVGNENLWPVGENIFQTMDFNFNPVQFTKKPAPESGYLMREVAASVK
ncbi:uncharacterized protein METZ01_LOCUS144928 [marine metagenome]|uniref:Uncharacterized protein n=1 Tax=marine metagenome TaxID=408172 RepID=A0A381ZSI4_9ZZZZ